MQRQSSPAGECARTVMAIQLDGSVKLVHLSTTPGLTDSKQILMFVKVSISHSVSIKIAAKLA